MSRQIEVQKLILKHQRRLQKLKEQKATLGISTPPEILTEIEDIETEIEDLQQELGIDVRNSPIKISIDKIRLSGTVIASLIALAGIGITAYFIYTVVMYPTAIIALRTSHDRYVTAGDGGPDWNWELRAETKTLSDWEKFRLLCLDDGKVAFKTHHSRYVTAGDGAPLWDWRLKAETETLDDWEKFTIVDAETETEFPCSGLLRQLKQKNVVIALKTHHVRYVTAMDNRSGWNWEIRAEREVAEGVGDSEKFTVLLLP